MDNASPDLSGLFGKLLENPEALKSAMDIASKLKSSGALDGILQKDEEQTYSKEEKAYNKNEKEEITAPAANSGADVQQRRQLLGALRPYMSSARREKIDMILKVLQLLEIAKQLGVIENNN